MHKTSWRTTLASRRTRKTLQVSHVAAASLLWRVTYPASRFFRPVRVQLSRQSWTIFRLQLRRWRREHVGALHSHTVCDGGEFVRVCVPCSLCHVTCAAGGYLAAWVRDIRSWLRVFTASFHSHASVAAQLASVHATHTHTHTLCTRSYFCTLVSRSIFLFWPDFPFPFLFLFSQRVAKHHKYFAFVGAIYLCH